MEQYTIETQGLNTYRVYECSKNDALDTVAIGMMQNNEIAGLLDMQVLRMDDICTLKFNISSKVTLSRFLTGIVKRERFLKVIRNIVDILTRMEEYLLDVGQLLLNKEDIYVNVSTLETDMLYYPVLVENKTLDINNFLKEILFSTEFDRSENCDYVVSFLNFLNTNRDVDIEELRKMLDEMLGVDKAPEVAPAPAVMASAAPAPTPMAAAAPVPMTAATPVPMTAATPAAAPKAVSMPTPVPAAVPAPAAAPVQMAVPGMAVPVPASTPANAKQKGKEEKKKVEKEKDKKGLFGKKNTKSEAAPAPMAVPGMAVPGMATPAKPVTPMQAQPVQPQMAAMQPQPMAAARPTVNFGETTVLQTPAIGETTVLGMDMQMPVAQAHIPVLERKKTNEKIVINKDTFRLGKEQQYVDYCIMDNSAVSRSHADIVKKDSDYYIVDNNSLNHTFVNGIQVVGSNPQVLKEGDIIMLANEEFTFKM